MDKKDKEKEEEKWYTVKHAKKAWKTIKTDFSYPEFVILLAAMIGFAVWADRFQTNLKLRRAAQAGLLAFIIGYLARMDLVFVAAIVVFSVVMLSQKQPGE